MIHYGKKLKVRIMKKVSIILDLEERMVHL